MFKIIQFLFLLMVFSCKEENPSNSSHEPSKLIIDANLSQGLHWDLSVNVDSLTRKFHFYVPETSNNETYPMVVLLHGHGGSADIILGRNGSVSPYKPWLEIAEKEKVFIVVPEGVISPDDRLGWNDCRGDTDSNPSTDDTAFIKGLIESIIDSYSVDKNRIYVSGTSNGGHMSFRLAIEMGNSLAAIAPVVAALPGNSECEEPRVPIPLLLINGTDDPIAPYAGGSMEGRGSILSTAKTIEIWNELNENTLEPEINYLPDLNEHDSSTIVKHVYKGDNINREVVLLEMQGSGHVEPSISEQYGLLWELIVGKQNHDVEMAQIVWEFFKNKSR